MSVVLERLLNIPLERELLPNGLTFLHSPDPASEAVSVQVWVKTGSIHEGPYSGCGISHYLEHMLFKGTKQRSFKDISAHIQAAGGNVNAYTTFDRTVYYIDGPAESCERFLEILSDMVFNSVLDPEETARERDVILREIDMGHDDPDHVASEQTFKTVFQKHPYRFPIIGERALYETLTRDDLWAYYRERYAPNNMVLVVGGNAKGVDLSACVSKYFGAEPMRRLSPVYLPAEPEQLAARTQRTFGAYQITRGSYAFTIPGMRHPDAAALDVLASVLGQGNSSLLYTRLHDELELVHEIYASSWHPGTTGILWINYVCDNGKDTEVEAAIAEVLSGLDAEKLDQAALNKARNRLLVSQVNALKTASGLATRAGLLEVVAEEIDYSRGYFERIHALTPAEVLGAANRYLVPSKRSCVVLSGDKARSAKSTPSAGAQSLPDFERHTLSNGVRVIHQRVSSLPKVHMKAICLGGPSYEAPAEKGACALLSTLLARDTAKRTAYEVARDIESVGGSFDEFAGNNTFGLNLEVLSDDLPLGIELLGQAITAPAFDEHTFDLEREGQVAQILENRDDIVGLGREHLRARFFGDHPFATDSLGSPEALEKLEPTDLAQLYKRLVVPQNLVLSVSGDYELKALIARLEDAFAGLKGGAFTPVKAPFKAPAQTGKVLEHIKREQTVILSAFPDVGAIAPENYTAEVLDELYSGICSSLFEEVRERRGLAYFVGAGRTLGLDMGMFTFSAGTTWEAHEEVLRLIREEIDRAASLRVSMEEFDRVRTRLKAQKRLSQQTPASRALTAGLHLAYGLSPNHWRDYEAQINAVTLESLANYAKRLNESVGLTLVLSPKA